MMKIIIVLGVCLCLNSCVNEKINNLNYLEKEVAQRLNTIENMQSLYTKTIFNIPAFKEQIVKINTDGSNLDKKMIKLFNIVGASKLNAQRKQDFLLFIETIEKDKDNLENNLLLLELFIFDEILIERRAPYYYSDVEPIVNFSKETYKIGEKVNARIQLKIDDSLEEHKAILFGSQTNENFNLPAKNGIVEFSATCNSVGNFKEKGAFLLSNNNKGGVDTIPFAIEWTVR